METCDWETKPVNQKWNWDYLERKEVEWIIDLEQWTLEGLQYLNQNFPQTEFSQGIHLQLIPSRYLWASIDLMSKLNSETPLNLPEDFTCVDVFQMLLVSAYLELKIDIEKFLFLTLTQTFEYKQFYTVRRWSIYMLSSVIDISSLLSLQNIGILFNFPEIHFDSSLNNLLEAAYLEFTKRWIVDETERKSINNFLFDE